MDDFATDIGGVVSMTENPIDGSIVYICVALLDYDYGTTTIVKKISYGGNKPPVAKITADNFYSPTSTLSVNFNGASSSDPDGTISSYAWDFGDPGSPDNLSSLSSPSHTFTTTPGIPKKYTVSLTVTDDLGATAEKQFVVSINNTPPTVDITSPLNNLKYKLGSDTLYTLSANVTDAEQGPGQLTYAWQSSLVHNNHSHPGSIDPTPDNLSINCENRLQW